MGLISFILAPGFLIGAALVLFIVGVVMLALGWRGKKLDNHRRCRKCRYDLYGSDALIAACPECGANLRKRRAAIFGIRKRQPRLIAGGWSCLVVLFFYGAGAGYVVSQGFFYVANKPSWWLKADIQSADVMLADEAWEELSRRYGTLDQASIPGLIDQALTQTSAGWRSEGTTYAYIEFLSSACLSDALTPAQREALFDQISRLTIKAEPVQYNRPGMFVDVRAASSVLDRGAFWRLNDISIKEIRIKADPKYHYDQRIKSIDIKAKDPHTVASIISLHGILGLADRSILDLPKGNYIVEADVHLGGSVAGHEMQARTVTIQTQYAWPGPPVHPIKLVNDDAIGKQLGSLLTQPRLEAAGHFPPTLSFNSKPLPVNLAGYLLLIRKKSILLSTTFIMRKGQVNPIIYPGAIEGTAHGPVDVMLIPDAKVAAALGLEDSDSIWGQALVFKQRPIQEPVKFEHWARRVYYDNSHRSIIEMTNRLPLPIHSDEFKDQLTVGKVGLAIKPGRPLIHSLVSPPESRLDPAQQIESIWTRSDRIMLRVHLSLNQINRILGDRIRDGMVEGLFILEDDDKNQHNLSAYIVLSLTGQMQFSLRQTDQPHLLKAEHLVTYIGDGDHCFLYFDVPKTSDSKTYRLLYRPPAGYGASQQLWYPQANAP